MKERLDELTLQELIDLSCGNHKVLLRGGERPSAVDILDRAAAIMSEYKSIAMPVQAKMDLVEGEQLEKLRIREKCGRICLLLCEQGRADMAREVLFEMDVNVSLLTTDEAVRTKCKAVINEAQFEIGRINEQDRERSSKKTSGPDGMRKAWMSEVAYVMSVFKMSIDPRSTNAAIYANLVRQSAERMRQLAKMPPMARMLM